MKTVLNVKTDADLKVRAQKLAEHLGIPLSTVVNAYLKEFVHEGEFTVRRDPELKHSVRVELNKSISEAERGKDVSQKFKTPQEAISWLRA